MAGNNSYAHQLDAKNRMRIPAKYRAELGDGYTVTIGTGGCLAVYSAEQWEKMKKMLSEVNPYREKQVQTARFILYYSWEAAEDNQGRILLPQNRRDYAKINKNVVVMKGPSNIEIWSEEVLNDYFKGVSFESLADAFDGLKTE